MKLRRNTRLLLLVLLLLLFVIVRLAIPISIEGDWTGQVGTCLCGHRNLVRFHEGRVTWYGHGGDPTRLKDWGTYRKVGWNRYLWTEPKRLPTNVRVGWLFSAYSGGFLNPNETVYNWRYLLPGRAEKLFNECAQMTAANNSTKTSQPNAQPGTAPNATPPPR